MKMRIENYVVTFIVDSFKDKTKKLHKFKLTVTNILIWYDRWSHALFHKLLVLGIHDYKWEWLSP